MPGPSPAAAELCLGFVNTWGNRADTGTDRLGDYDDLLTWAVAAGVLDTDTSRRLATSAASRPDDAAAVVERARALREAVYGAVSALIDGGDPEPEPLEVVNRALERSLPRLRLRADRACCRLEWSAPPDALDQMLWPVARAAAELLTSTELQRVRECASPDCSWLFLDTSRNRSRKWCDMAGCGNRAKARRYYHRHQARGG